MRNAKRASVQLVMAALVGLGLSGCPGPSGGEDAGSERDAGVDAGPIGTDGGPRDAGGDRDAGETPDGGTPPVPMGTYVQGGLGTLGGSPSGGRYRVVEADLAGGGTSCGGAYCVHGGVMTGRGLTGAEP